MKLFEKLTDARAVLLAVSGGPDSTAMMHLAAAWAAGGGRPAVAVASVDHGLQPGSDVIAHHVLAAAARLGLPGRVLTWTGPKPERAIQERAREARYRMLQAYADEIGASHIVTAHTLDDQAETLMFRMARGTGLTGLRGMAPFSRRNGVAYARPFLATPKAELVALCRQNDWFFVEDPANRNHVFARARWRALLPALAAEGLTPTRLGHLSERVARADEALETWSRQTEAVVTQSRENDARHFDFTRLAREPEEIILRVLLRALADLNGKRPVRLERLERLVQELLRHRALQKALRRTLHGCDVTLARDGRLALRQESPRQRGMSAAPNSRLDGSSEASGQNHRIEVDPRGGNPE